MEGLQRTDGCGGGPASTAMRTRAALLLLLLGGTATLDSGAAEPAGKPVAGRSPDQRIAAALTQISSGRIRSTIAALVGFGTRSTISAQDPAAIAAGHGIGAAREWIKAQFAQYSATCGGCL